MLGEENRLLNYFGCKSHSELMAYIKNNSEDEKVKEIKEIFEIYFLSLDEEVDSNEK